MNDIEFRTRKSANASLKKFEFSCLDSDYIEVTEWANGEGFTVDISAYGKNVTFDLSYDALAALNYLTTSLTYNLGKE